MQTLWRDVRYAARMLWKSPGFTLVAVLALALGIGANSAIFSVVNAVLLRPLPYPEPDRLVRIYGNFLNQKLPRISVSVPEFIDYQTQSTVFEQIAAVNNLSANLANTNGGEPEWVQAQVVTHGFFAVLGIAPIHGRAFLPEEDQPGRNDVVVVGYGLWRRRFGADPKLVGQTIGFNNGSYTVVGIMPPIPGSEQVELWTPIGFTPELLSQDRRGTRFLNVVARLKPDITPEQAQSEMAIIARRLQAQYPQNYREQSGWAVSVVPLLEVAVGQVRPALLVLLGAVGFVLLIACANVANLLLVRAAGRGKELAIRTALGASRWRIIRQLLTESVLLSIVGGALGLLLAWWGLDLLLSSAPANLPRIGEVTLDNRVLLFTAAVSLGVGLLFGLSPAVQASNQNLNETLKEGGRSAGGGAASSSQHRMRSLLVISEIALALVLLVGAGLLIKSFVLLQRTSPGFDPQNVLTMHTSLAQTKYREPAERATFFRGVIERVETMPGVQSAGAISALPLGPQGSSGTTTGEGSQIGPTDLPVESDFRWITPNYFRAMNIPLVKGRYFTHRDTEAAERVAIVDETFARRFYPNEDAIGKRIKRGGAQSQNPWLVIVGIVGHVKHHGLTAESRVQSYFPFYQDPVPSTMSLVARTSAEPTSMVAAVRNAVQTIDKDQPVFNVRTMEQVFADSITQQRLSVFLFSIFAAVALILAGVGIYGVMAYSVTQRTHEIGIRMALGAGRRDVLRMVVGQGMALALAGVALGLVAALVASRLLASLLYGVSTTDPWTFAGVSIILGGVALLACYIPARRATRVDPMVALRHE